MESTINDELLRAEIANEAPPQNPRELLMRLVDRFGKVRRIGNRVVLARNIFYAARPYMKSDKNANKTIGEPMYISGAIDQLLTTGPRAIWVKVQRMDNFVQEYQERYDKYSRVVDTGFELHPVAPGVLPMTKASQLASEIVGDVLLELELSGFFAGEEFPKIILSEHDEDAAGFRPVR